MVIKSLVELGFIVTASWPMVIVNKNRLHAQNVAAVSSSIYVVARKSKKKDLTWLKDVNNEIKKKLPEKLDHLINEGIKSSDFFIAGLGLGIYTKYQRVLNNNGNEIGIEKQLNQIRNDITEYILQSILDFQISNYLSPLTKFYILWRWSFQHTNVPFDDAQKLAQSVGINLFDEWDKGFIIKQGNIIQIEGSENRDKKSLECSTELIDILHLLCLYMERK